MEHISVEDAARSLMELVENVASTRTPVTTTRDGEPVAVLWSVEEFESVQETLYWLGQPGIHESLTEARANIAAGRTFAEDQVRSEFGVLRSEAPGVDV